MSGQTLSQPRRTFHLPPARKPRNWGEGMKRCPACREIKPLTAFNRNAGRSNNLGVYCKPCHAVAQRKSYDRSPQKAFARLIQGVILALLRHGPMTPDEIGTQVRNKTGDRSITNRAACRHAKHTPGVQRLPALPRGSLYILAPKIDAGPPPPVIHPKVKVRPPKIERADADPWFATLRKEAEVRKERLNTMRSRA